MSESKTVHALDHVVEFDASLCMLGSRLVRYAMQRYGVHVGDIEVVRFDSDIEEAEIVFDHNNRRHSLSLCYSDYRDCDGPVVIKTSAIPRNEEAHHAMLSPLYDFLEILVRSAFGLSIEWASDRQPYIGFSIYTEGAETVLDVYVCDDDPQSPVILYGVTSNGSQVIDPSPLYPSPFVRSLPLDNIAGALFRLAQMSIDELRQFGSEK